MSEVTVAVAVLTQPGAAADQLRQALDSAGAEVVWQGPPDQFEAGDLPGDVVVVNLDPDTESHLARIEALLADGTVRVVFNDATVSAGLSGWDLQRWARHLAAKVLNSQGLGELPEPPPGAEPLNVPAAGAQAAEDGDAGPVTLRLSGQLYIEDVISAELGEPPLPYQDAAGAVQDVARTAGGAVSAPPAPEPAGLSLEPLDSDALGADDGVIGPEPERAGVETSEAIGEDTSYLGGLSLEPLEPADPPGATSGEGVPGLQFTDDIDLITAESGDSGAPELAAFEDAREPPAGGEAADAGRSGFSFGELSLEPIELEDETRDAPPPQPRSAPPPAVAVPAAAAKAPEFSIDLESDAPATGSGPGAEVGSAGGPPSQLWVLAGALGGPEAITQFFNALPAPTAAAFLVVTHFERGDAQALARSLAASGKHRAEVAGSGARAARGSILVAPEGSRVSVDREGNVHSVALDSPAGMIDQCARAAADAFGMDAGIIIFSGSARDGFEGALYMAQRGGVVWTQDPATCVAGGMAEAIRARGLATYIGSPRGLAEHFVQEFC
jgi:two-component system chemotaxis response regulator CheB/chemosensory pili system protein ChpB (putative protein-glutamate methylesterase)